MRPKELFIRVGGGGWSSGAKVLLNDMCWWTAWPLAVRPSQSSALPPQVPGAVPPPKLPDRPYVVLPSTVVGGLAVYDSRPLVCRPPPKCYNVFGNRLATSMQVPKRGLTADKGISEAGGPPPPGGPVTQCHPVLFFRSKLPARWRTPWGVESSGNKRWPVWRSGLDRISRQMVKKNCTLGVWTFTPEFG